MVVRRRIQLQRPLDHGRGPSPLSERKQRFSGISGQHGSHRALQAKITCHVYAAQSLPGSVLISAYVVESIGVVDEKAEQSPGAGTSKLTNPLHHGDALVLSPSSGKARAERDPGIRGGRIGIGHSRNVDGLLGILNALLDITLQHRPPSKHLQNSSPERGISVLWYQQKTLSQR